MAEVVTRIGCSIGAEPSQASDKLSGDLVLFVIPVHPTGHSLQVVDLNEEFQIFTTTLSDWIQCYPAQLRDISKLCFSEATVSALEFINSMVQALAWPALIAGVLFYYKDKLAELIIEMKGIKFHVKLVKQGEGPKTNSASPQIKHETSYYKLYSNGVLVQDLKIRIAPGIENLPLVYPITFPNELLSIQAIGDDFAWPVRASLSNCDLRIVPSSSEREIQLRISGI